MKRYRILCVDDENDIREVAALALETDPNFEVQTCASGDAALALASRFDPHLILLDWVMPGLNGAETLRRLRETPALAKTPVVFVTAHTSAKEVARLMSLGAAGIVPKPFDPAALAGIVRNFLPK